MSVPPGPHVLRVGLLETGFTNVKLGAPGADGPVVDHWNARGRPPLPRPHVGGPRPRPRRAPRREAAAARCARASWTASSSTTRTGRTTCPAEFARRRGYELAPYLPFVLERDDPGDDTPRADTVRRARYDFHRTLVELFQRALPGDLRRLGARERAPRPDAGLRPRDARARGQPAGGPAGGRELALVGPRPDRGEPDRRQQVRLLGGAPGRAGARQLRGDDERRAGLPRDAGGLQAGDGPERSSPASTSRSSTASATRPARRASPAGSGSARGSASRTPGGRTSAASRTTRRASRPSCRPRSSRRTSPSSARGPTSGPATDSSTSPSPRSRGPGTTTTSGRRSSRRATGRTS